MCPLSKTIGMMKVIVHFHDTAQKIIAESTGDHKIGWNTINQSMRETIVKITSMKFEMPRQPDAHFKVVFQEKLVDEITAGFRNLTDN
jgi:V-type H+-transporting ATPase subunit A